MNINHLVYYIIVNKLPKVSFLLNIIKSTEASVVVVAFPSLLSPPCCVTHHPSPPVLTLVTTQPSLH